jgi:hypothetical protein
MELIMQNFSQVTSSRTGLSVVLPLPAEQAVSVARRIYDSANSFFINMDCIHDEVRFGDRHIELGELKATSKTVYDGEFAVSNLLEARVSIFLFTKIRVNEHLFYRLCPEVDKNSSHPSFIQTVSNVRMRFYRSHTDGLLYVRLEDLVVVFKDSSIGPLVIVNNTGHSEGEQRLSVFDKTKSVQYPGRYTSVQDVVDLAVADSLGKPQRIQIVDLKIV